MTNARQSRVLGAQQSQTSLKVDSTSSRKIPRLMMPPVKNEAVTGSTSIALAFVNDVEGQCPICKKQMPMSVANGVNVYVCIDHSVAMPIRNEGQ